MKIATIGELRQAIEGLNDNDQLLVEIHEGQRTEDLYPFSIDIIEGIELINGTKVNEIRFCI